MRLLKNQFGVALILEIILLAVVLSAIGTVGYSSYTAKQQAKRINLEQTATSKKKSETPPTTTDTPVTTTTQSGTSSTTPNSGKPSSGTSKPNSSSTTPSTPPNTYYAGTGLVQIEIDTSSRCLMHVTQSVNKGGSNSGQATVQFNISTSPNVGNFGGPQALNFTSSTSTMEAKRTIDYVPPTTPGPEVGYQTENVQVTISIKVTDDKGNVVRTSPTRTYQCPNHPIYSPDYWTL